MSTPERGVSIDRYGRKTKPPTREVIVEAAIVLLSAQGVRRLTHRRVDAEAGLPEGTTSFHFRTSEALTLATLEGIIDRERAVIEGLPRAATPQEAVEVFSALVAALLGPFRDLVIARHALMLDARARPALRELIVSAYEELRAALVTVLADAGATDPDAAAASVLPVLDGLLLHATLGIIDVDQAAMRLERDVRSVLAP